MARIKKKQVPTANEPDMYRGPGARKTIPQSAVLPARIIKKSLARHDSRDLVTPPTAGSAQAAKLRDHRRAQTIAAHQAAEEELEKESEEGDDDDDYEPSEGNLPLDIHNKPDFDDPAWRKQFRCKSASNAHESRKKLREIVQAKADKIPTPAEKAMRRAKYRQRNIARMNGGEAWHFRNRMLRTEREEKAHKAVAMKVKEIASKPSSVVKWTGLNIPCSVDKCTFENKEICLDHLVLVRHTPGTFKADGFVPDVPVYSHIDCLSKGSLAHLNAEGRVVFAKGVPPDAQDAFQAATTSAAAAIAARPPEPTLPKKHRILSSSLSKRRYMQLLRSQKKAPAAFHKHYDAMKGHIEHIVHESAKREAAAEIGSQLKESERKRRKLEQELAESRVAEQVAVKSLQHMTALATSNVRHGRYKAMLKKRTKEAAAAMQVEAHNTTINRNIVMSRIATVLSSDAKLQEALEDAIDAKFQEGQGSMVVESLSKLVNMGDGYLMAMDRENVRVGQTVQFIHRAAKAAEADAEIEDEVEQLNREEEAVGKGVDGYEGFVDENEN